MKKVITIILDGFGMREDIYGNAVKMAGMTNFINIWNKYPHCLLKASGEAIGLPEDQCSSSELGHEIFGAGRDINYKINDLNETFKKDRLKYNPKYNELIADLLDKKNNLHIVALLSDGGVSSHINHLISFIKELRKSKVNNNIFIHALSDGKDSDRKSIIKYMNKLESSVDENVKISSICGRFYCLDVNKTYKKLKTYYELLFESKGVNALNLNRVINKCYERKVTDEYLPPLKTASYTPIEKDDILMIMNYSEEEQIELLNSIVSKSFDGFSRLGTIPKVYSLYPIAYNLNKNYFFDNKRTNNTLIEYLSSLGINQARIFEECKKYSMTYYLDGKRNLKLDNCNTICIPSISPDDIIHKPELNSLQVAKTAIKCMEEDYDFILANIANADIVGHTGNFQATINSLQAVDVCLGKILEAAEDNFYKVIILSTHAKADTIIDRDNNIVTKNTLSSVPFIILDKKVKLRNGNLKMAAPTILSYLDIALPKEMKETEILLEKNK
ncbi:MAG: phosphoglycerate mutase (2,3-diphosphoglycerate-independent) [Bacilli bacterium]|nr:phosphoglycerate mutase (2,3-diphosphoglycerate-independent) [Bacilli bacterium]